MSKQCCGIKQKFSNTLDFYWYTREVKVAGWVKLWRQLKDNGHLKMPGSAFKLWIYCLLEAAPYPNRARELEAGELWLNYEHVRQFIGEKGRQMSKSTISKALKYLEQNGYLKLQVKKFYGVKVCVVNWQEYQSSTETVLGKNPAMAQVSALTGTETVPVEDPPSTETVHGKNPVMAQDSAPTSTETVPVEGPPSTETVLAESPPGTPTSTETVPDPVLARAPEAYSGKASRTPKNNKNKDLYIDTAAADIADDFKKEFGRPLSPLEVSQLISWREEFSPDLIKEALTRAVIQNKRTLAYIGGILSNWKQAGIYSIDDARREKHGQSRRTGKQDQYSSEKKEIIRSLYNNF